MKTISLVVLALLCASFTIAAPSRPINPPSGITAVKFVGLKDNKGPMIFEVAGVFTRDSVVRFACPSYPNSVPTEISRANEKIVVLTDAYVAQDETCNAFLGSSQNEPTDRDISPRTIPFLYPAMIDTIKAARTLGYDKDGYLIEVDGDLKGGGIYYIRCEACGLDRLDFISYSPQQILLKLKWSETPNHCRCVTYKRLAGPFNNEVPGSNYSPYFDLP